MLRRRLMVAIVPSVMLGLSACGGCSLFGGKAEAEKPPKRVLLRLHVAASEPLPGYREIRDELGQPLFVAPESFLTERDVQDAVVFAGAQGSMVRVEFNMAGTAALERVTRQETGRWLVVFVDDALLMTARINSPVRGGKALLGGDFTRARAEEIAKGLTVRETSATGQATTEQP